MILGFGLCTLLKSLNSSPSSVSVCVLLCVSFFSDFLCVCPMDNFLSFYFEGQVSVVVPVCPPPTSLNSFTCVSFLTCLPYAVNFQYI